jgi:hypothetical protein
MRAPSKEIEHIKGKINKRDDDPKQIERNTSNDIGEFESFSSRINNFGRLLSLNRLSFRYGLFLISENGIRISI